MRVTANDYYRLIKPGIIYGNVFHAVIGLLLAHHIGIQLGTALGLVGGIALVIASACVANNILDRHIDAHMERTRRRAMVTRIIDTRTAVVISIILAVLGLIILISTTNWLTVGLVVLAHIWYVWVYGWAKRRTWWSTLVGTVPGAIPILAGYTAISSQLDIISWLLFGLLVAWQMPHFYAIALFREHEYRQANLPVVSIVLGRQATYVQMVWYAALYTVFVAMLGVTGAVSWLIGSIMVALACYWLATIVLGYRLMSDAWARRVFKQSLLLTVSFMVLALVNVWLA